MKITMTRQSGGDTIRIKREIAYKWNARVAIDDYGSTDNSEESASSDTDYKDGKLEMIYIYDTVIEPYQTAMKRYGIAYKLENRTRMGDQLFYTFTATGQEKMLVIPHFAEQYRQVERFYKKVCGLKKLEICISHIKKELNKRVVVEEIPNENSETGIMTVISVDYIDIRVQFEHMNHHLAFSPEFEIMNNNIFGNGIVVIMNMDMEDAT